MGILGGGRGSFGRDGLGTANGGGVAGRFAASFRLASGGDAGVLELPFAEYVKDPRFHWVNGRLR